MEKKKTKLTISGNPNKSFKKFDSQPIGKTAGKKTVVIERPKTRLANKGIFNKYSQQTNNIKRRAS